MLCFEGKVLKGPDMKVQREALGVDGVKLQKF
jgi:hypothetical protein